MAHAKIVTRARVEGLVITALAGGYLLESRNIPALFQSPGVPGPAAFPTLVGTIFALGGLWRLVRGASPAEAGAAKPEEAPAAAERGGVLAALGRGWRFYALWAAILAFLALMPIVGFPVSAAVVLAALFVLLGETRPQWVIGLSLAAPAIMYFGFVKGLGVRLPLGVLEALVK